MSAVLEITDAKRVYRNGRGLQETNLMLNEGEILGLLGANGSGKTTLLKIACALTKPDAGSVTICGVPLSEDPVKALGYVGALIETPAVYPNLSARDNLKVACAYRQLDAKKYVDRLLEIFGLTNYQKDKVRRYSLGMKQRMALALAFLGDKKLILLDEPTNGLDIASKANTKNMIKHACFDLGAAVIISSHLSDELEKLSTRVRILKNGYTAADVPIEQALANGAALEDFYLAVTREGNE